MEAIGNVSWVSGPVVRMSITGAVQMEEQVQVGKDLLIGEIIGVRGTTAIIQVYEETGGVTPGDEVYGSGAPLSAELGPGLIGQIFDGILRPLEELAKQSGDFIARGVTAPSLNREKKWHFAPAAQTGTDMTGGELLGHVPETPLIKHSVMLAPHIHGKLTWIAPEGDYTVTDVIAHITQGKVEQPVTMMQRWPVRVKRPIAERFQPDEPLITGQRVIDALFPVAKGGTAALPGGFGAGKTVLQHALAKWADADIVIYIGCGERGNEMTDVLTEFPKLIDPATGHSLMERTILIANTSNMPVAAREASIYTGITLAEYYRDMGYHVALMADSTSRWAEALREVSGRLEEMPAEEGFPAYLPSRLAGFYERAGLTESLCGRRGSITVVGAVSPPSGDFSEPVTQHTRRFIRTFWALDKTLAAARHFPSINWLNSYSGYSDVIAAWHAQHGDPRWQELQQLMMDILQEESQLQEIVKLVGADTLPDSQRLVLFIARLIKEAFLQQNAMDEIDGYTTPEKQRAILELVAHAYKRGGHIIEMGAPSYRLENQVSVWPQIIRAKSTVKNEDQDTFKTIRAAMDEQLDAIEKDYRE